jgi:hypothetical protein
MSAEIRRQHETTNQNETTNHDGERKLPVIPVREEENDEALSRATTLAQNSVAGAIPPIDMADVDIATSVPVVRRVTQSLGLIVTVVDGGGVDGDTVDRILGEAEDENGDLYASCSVYHPELNQDDDEECPASPMREILLRNRFVGVDFPAPVVDPPSLLAFTVAQGRGRCLGCAGQAVMHGRGRVRGRATTLPEEDYTGHKVAFPLDASVWSDYSLPAFLNSSIITNYCKYLMVCRHQTRWRMENCGNCWQAWNTGQPKQV